MDLLPVTAGHLNRERGRDTSVKGVQICPIRMAQNCGRHPAGDSFDKCHERATEQGCLMWGATLVIPNMHQQKVHEEPKLTPLHPWEFPDGPWRRIYVDFGGPFQGKASWSL